MYNENLPGDILSPLSVLSRGQIQDGRQWIIRITFSSYLCNKI